MKPNCHVCGEVSPFLLHKDGYDLYRCPKCSLVFVHPQPTEEWLRNDLYSFESGFQTHRAEDLSKTTLDARRRKLLQYLSKKRPGASILDVGCGGGHFLYWAKKKSFNIEGVELNKRLADSATEQGVPVHAGLLTDLPEDKQYDVIVLGELIEHVRNPREVVLECKKRLKPGGLLAISTPNLNCAWSHTTYALYKLFRIPWSSVTPPYHLFQFNNINLDLLLKEAVFTKKAAWYLPPPRLMYELGSMHLLKRYKKSKSFLDLAYMVFAFSIYIPLYAVSYILHPFMSYDFGMNHVYKKS